MTALWPQGMMMDDMYNTFFDFRESPFKLVPNPAFLFLSRSHEEALAHLAYATTHGDGFVVITGEVGTGKTTLCRSFLENLDADTEAAFIFNPKLDPIQLLKTINGEFGIDAEADDAKTLIDRLNAFLLENKAKNKNAIILIDESQNLTSEVLEQLRLLSNLETTRHKLLQIILVGQPELDDMLQSYALRQLGQRITLNSHLRPLTAKEVQSYIEHRIHVAAHNSAARFTSSAYRHIFRYSKGIPRLINIICDRALLMAFGQNTTKISGQIARAAIHELSERRRFSADVHGNHLRMAILMGLLCLTAGVFYYMTTRELEPQAALSAKVQQPTEIEKKEMVGPSSVSRPTPESPLVQPTESVRQIPDTLPPQTVEPVALPVEIQPIHSAETHSVLSPKTPVASVSLKEVMANLTMRDSRRAALEGTLKLWDRHFHLDLDLDRVDDNPSFFRLGAQQGGLMVRRIDGSIEHLRALNLPAILECYLPGTLSPRYLALIQMSSGLLSLVGDGKLMHLAPEKLTPFWAGVAYIPWKNFVHLPGTIPLNGSRDGIITLKILLRDIGFTDIEINPFFDETAREAVKKIQKKYGIDVDGIVGSTTKMVLYNEKDFPAIPHLHDKEIQVVEN